MDWKEYFNQHPTNFEETDFLQQMGKTVSGKSITPEQFEAQIASIIDALEIQKNDLVLDLCCGNGVITTRISTYCSSIVGIDFSDTLINLANKYNKPANTFYDCMSITDENMKNISKELFTKVYMYEALQHFPEEDIPKILNLLKGITTPNSVIFIGSIPDKDRIWDFYDTEERRKDYFYRKSIDQEAIGVWWQQSEIKKVCLDNGFDCKVLPQNAILHSAHYRFDIRLTQRTGF